MLGALVIVVGAVFVAELYSRRRTRRIDASLARMTSMFKGRRHPEQDLEIETLHGHGDVVWILFRGAAAAQLAPYLKFDQLSKASPSLTEWLRSLNAEIKTKTLADGWSPKVGFESVERVAGDPWSYFE